MAAGDFGFAFPMQTGETPLCGVDETWPGAYSPGLVNFSFLPSAGGYSLLSGSTTRTNGWSRYHFCDDERGDGECVIIKSVMVRY